MLAIAKQRMHILILFAIFCIKHKHKKPIILELLCAIQQNTLCHIDDVILLIQRVPCLLFDTPACLLAVGRQHIFAPHVCTLVQTFHVQCP